jgi:hypothetical protein
LFLAAMTASAAKPEKMVVVVRTQDQVITDYVCSEQYRLTTGRAVIGTQVTRKGGMEWHVVGGTPPYRVIRDESDVAGKGDRCITVMDANGQVAQGCGVVGVQRLTAVVDCDMGPDHGLDDPPHVKAPGNEVDASDTTGYTDTTVVHHDRPFKARLYNPEPGMRYEPPVKWPGSVEPVTDGKTGTDSKPTLPNYKPDRTPGPVTPHDPVDHPAPAPRNPVVNTGGGTHAPAPSPAPGPKPVTPVRQVAPAAHPR